MIATKPKQQVLGRSARQLVEQIYSHYSVHATIELRVLLSDTMGRVLFQGPPDSLVPSVLESVLVDPCTYYLFKIAVLVDNSVECSTIEPKMFGWITTPPPPTAEHTGSTTMKLTWSPLKLYGNYNPELLADVVYILEAAQATEYRKGVMAKYRTDLEGNDYKVVARGHALTTVQVTELKSNHWYNCRVSLEYLGLRFIGDYRPIATQQGPAPKPHRPTLIVKTSQTPGLFKRQNKSTILKFVWKAAQPSITEKYQLQIEEKCKEHMACTNSDPARLSTGRSNGARAGDTNMLIVVPAVSESCGCRPWRTIYSDIHSFYKSRPPNFGPAEWRVRVRSWNTAGWSKFSEPLIINYKTHSELFLAGFINRAKTKMENSLHTESDDYLADGFEDMEVENPEIEDKKSLPPDRPHGQHVDTEPLLASDEKLIRRLACELGVTDRFAKQELAQFISQFPPSSNIGDDEVEVT